MTITELKSLADYCGLTLAELAVQLQYQSPVEIMAESAKRRLKAEMAEMSKQITADFTKWCECFGSALEREIPNEQPADRFDRLTASGFKLNLVTGRWER